MKRTKLLGIFAFLMMMGGLLSSCQKDESVKQDNANSKELKLVEIDCTECLEDWAESLETYGPSYFVPQSSTIPAPTNIFLDVWQDATTIYYRLYVNGGEPIKHLSIDGNLIFSYLNGDPSVTEYSWSEPLPADWEACDVIRTNLIVGGLYVHGIPHYNACIDYTLRNWCNWECSDSETAWADGERYTPRGNWATYTAYNDLEQTVEIFAGQNILIGTVHFSALANGEVTLTFDLNDGWRFEDVAESLKIQTYDVAPTGNPSPGQFAYKYDATGDSYTVTLPDANFYGIHLDVTHCVMVE